MDKKAERKQLQEKFKAYQTPMGLYQVKNEKNGRFMVATASNLPGKLNSTIFQLKLGSYILKELQDDWRNFGEEAFEMSVLEELAYDVNDPQKNYQEDLAVLKELWLEKLTDEELALMYQR